MSDIEKKLAAARTRLILDKPFLGALVMRLPMLEADPSWCGTTATDAKTFYYNAEYIDRLQVAQVQFVLAHEALHCALSHFSRRQHRVKQRWDIACDYAVNPLLLSDDLMQPPGVLYDRSFEGMTAEEIYPCIDENSNDDPMDKHLYDEEDNSGDTGGSQDKSQDKDEPSESENKSKNESEKQSSQGEGQQQQPDDGGEQAQNTQPQDAQGEGKKPETDPEAKGAPQPPPLNQKEKEELSVQWQQRLAGAAQQAQQAGKLGGAMARLIEHLLQPQLPWRMLLARYMTALSRDDYSYMRPSRREGAAILPSLRSSQINIVVAVDTSGSIADGEIDEFIAEVNAIKGQVRARLSLIACDMEISEGAPWVFEPWEEVKMPEFKGGGGTSFVPVFEWANDQSMAPDLLVYFTDAKGQFPETEPYYPVIWLVKGKQKAPWGQRIQLN